MSELPASAKKQSFNAETIAALRETEAIATGKIQVEWQHPPATKEELKVQLRKMKEQQFKV